MIDFQKIPLVDELERFINFKQAEAKMYQECADDARREVKGLKHASITKNSKINKGYARQIEKL